MSSQEASKKTRDKWDKIDIILKPVGGLLTGISVAAVGLIVNSSIQQRQEYASNSRLYSELMSRREQAECALRKDMFQSIIQSFVSNRKGKKELESQIERDLLNLELLGYNFHESIVLRPLFSDLDKRIDMLEDRDRFRRRLQKVAKEIVRKQIATLQYSGIQRMIEFDFDSVNTNGQAHFRPLERKFLLEHGLDKHEVVVRLKGVDAQRSNAEVHLLINNVEDRSDDYSETEGASNPTSNKAFASLADVEFTSSFFDFPMIDNIRVPGNIRYCVSPVIVRDGYVALELLGFKGQYASMKDKPYYEDILKNLQQTTLEEG